MQEIQRNPIFSKKRIINFKTHLKVKFNFLKKENQKKKRNAVVLQLNIQVLQKPRLNSLIYYLARYHIIVKKLVIDFL